MQHSELPTQEGEELEMLSEDLASDWLWCRARNGREGWVPEPEPVTPGRIISPRIAETWFSGSARQ